MGSVSDVPHQDLSTFYQLQVIEGDIELESRGSWCDNSHTVINIENASLRVTGFLTLL